MAENAIARAFGKINPWSWLRTLSDNDTGILPFNGAPTNGTSGSYNSIAGKGCLLLDLTNGVLYINTGTKASPTWSLAASTTGAALVNATLTGTTSIGTGATLTSPTINSPVISTILGNSSVAQVTGAYAADTYLAGSSIAIPNGGYVAKARYYCCFDMVKTAAGTAQFTITLRIGTAGSTADAAICSFAFAAGTAAVDTGTFEVFATFRTVGAGTSAVVAGVAYCSHALAATGLVSTGASGNGQIQTTSSGFDSTVANTIIGLSVNGGASFSGTNNVVQAELHQF